MSTIYRITLICMLMGLTGCISTGTDLSHYKTEPLQKAETQPSAEALAKQSNKVILHVVTETPHLQEANYVGTLLHQTVEAILNKVGADITDRKMELALGNERRLAETVTTENYSGPRSADYLIRIILTEAQYQTTPIPAHEGRDWLGRKRKFPLSFDHKAWVSANIQIYRFPDLELLKTIPVRGHSDQGEVEHDRNQAVAMLRESVENSLRGAEKTQLLNQFSIKGHIVDRKLKGNDSLFLVTLGNRQGAKPGAKVGLYSIRKQAHALTGRPHDEEISLADGTLTDQITENNAWVLVTDHAKARQVRAGDVARIKHESSLLEGVINKLK